MPGWVSRALVMLVWVVALFEAVTMGAAGLAKFAAADSWNRLFAGWGYPPGFS